MSLRVLTRTLNFFTNFFFIEGKNFYFSVRDRILNNWENKHIKVNEFPNLGEGINYIRNNWDTQFTCGGE